MILSKNKDKLLRKKLERVELKKKELKIVFVNLMNDSSIFPEQKKLVVKELVRKLHKRTSKSRVMKRCLLTNKARVMHKSFKISRVKLKDMLEFGLVPGYKKAVW